MSESRESRLRCLAETVAAYGGECVCCGENEPYALDVCILPGKPGNRLRAQLGAETSHPLRALLRRLGFPAGAYVRCVSCTRAATLAHGECPAAAEHAILREQRNRVRALWRRQLEQNPGLVVPEHVRL